VRQLTPYPVWIGHVGHARDARGVLTAGIRALVDLAVNEPPTAVHRELVYCRFPLVDGAGNDPWLLRAAVDVTASLIRSGTPTLVFCGAGMSRSPAVIAAALSVVEGRSPQQCLEQVTGLGPMDVSPGLWRDVCAVVNCRG
jgi:hypothetical protein